VCSSAEIKLLRWRHPEGVEIPKIRSQRTIAAKTAICFTQMLGKLTMTLGKTAAV
jgi:hypothetical protein